MLVPLEVWCQRTQMHQSLFTTAKPGKLASQHLAATSQPGSNITSRLFYITDKYTGTRFLVDTSAEVSVLPRSQRFQGRPTSIQLQAVNHSPIVTHGEKSLTLDFGLRRVFRWVFIVADLPTPIIGADFLRQFNLLVDVKNQKLIDSTTSLAVQGVTSNKPSVCSDSRDSIFMLMYTVCYLA